MTQTSSSSHIYMYLEHLLDFLYGTRVFAIMMSLEVYLLAI